MPVGMDETLLQILHDHLSTFTSRKGDLSSCNQGLKEGLSEPLTCTDSFAWAQAFPLGCLL